MSVRFSILAVTVTLFVLSSCDKRPSPPPTSRPTTAPTTGPAPDVVLSGDVPDDYTAHSFSTGDATVKAPSAWKVQTPAPTIPGPGTVVLSSGGRDAFGLVAVDTDGVTLEESMAQGKQQFKDMPPARDAKVIRTDYIKIPAGVAARLVTDLTSTDGVRMRNHEVIFTRGKRMYILNFGIPVVQYGAMEPTYDLVTKSLELK